MLNHVLPRCGAAKVERQGGEAVQDIGVDTTLDREGEEHAPPREDRPRSRLRTWEVRAREVVVERPVASVLAAVAVGYVIARLVTRR